MRPLRSDAMPRTPSRFAVYTLADRVKHLCQRAQELTIAGPGMDVARAEALLDQARALLGERP